MTSGAMLLAGRGALVTGAAHGVGLALVELLTEHGARVLMADLDEDALRAAASAFGDRVRPVAADLARAEAADEVVAQAVDFLGVPDIVVNNAGCNLNSRLERMSDDDWQRMLDIHVTAPFRILRAAAPHLIAAAAQDQRVRKIVNVTSIALMGSAYQANYAAGKAAVVGLTKSLAKEWAQHRIAVNAVGFGSLDTRLTRPRDAGNTLPDGTQLGLSSKATAVTVDAIPFGRLGTAREGAGAVFLLCTPWSDWVTGQVLLASGGQVFGMSG
jgi:3-oxoacyl-[acyl-carrier protein] reductase